MIEKFYTILPQRSLLFVAYSLGAFIFSQLLFHQTIFVIPFLTYGLISLATVLSFELFPALRSDTPKIIYIGIKIALLTLVSLPTSIMTMPTLEDALLLSWASGFLLFCALHGRGRLKKTIPLFKKIINFLPDFKTQTLTIIKSVEQHPMSSYSYLEGKTVFVTGADTDYGQRLVQHLLASFPQKIIMLGMHEITLSQTQKIAHALVPGVETKAIIILPGDKDHLQQVFESHTPDYVFHNSHVKESSILESNPGYAALANSLFTRRISDFSRRFGAKAMVLFSGSNTDSPLEVKDMTRRLSEIYCQCLAVNYPQSTTQTYIIRCDQSDPATILTTFERLRHIPPALGYIYHANGEAPVAPHPMDYGNLNRVLDRLESLVREQDNEGVKSLLQALVQVTPDHQQQAA